MLEKIAEKIMKKKNCKNKNTLAILSSFFCTYPPIIKKIISNVISN